MLSPRWIYMCLLLAAAPAFGAPRDEAMSGAFRCAAIGDNKTWLDCYYGAAQPVRSALGMTPAPPGQTRLVQAPPAGAVAPGDQSARNAVMANAFRCNDGAEQRQWLSCYYAAAQPMRARIGLASPAPQPVTAAPMPTPAPEFGMRAPKPQTDHLGAQMQSYSFDRYGAFTVTLNNGQVWQQISGDDSKAKWTKPAGSYAVSITRGFLGAYNFQVKNSAGIYRVRRLT